MILPPAPPTPMISAAPPPLNRRRFQNLMPESNGVLSPNSVDSAYSNVDTGVQNVPPPPRARTPVYAAKHLAAPLSAPMPHSNLISPLPRSPISAAPFRMREVSESLREHKDSDSSKSKLDWDRTDYRLSRSARASPAPPPGPRSPVQPLPPRSNNRPGSAMSQRTPVAVPQHEGMI
jgi:hypothetical protein